MTKRKINSNFYVLAVDVETSGSSYERNGILSIGASLHDQDSVERESFQINVMLPKEKEYEKDCLKNFWDKNPEAKRFVENNAIEAKEAMQKFYDFLMKVRPYSDIVIISDNPSFDIAWIDHYLGLYIDQKPLRYLLNDNYKMVWDAASIQKNWLCIKTSDSSFHSPPRGHKDKLELTSPYPHDHNPLNDARSTAYCYLQTLSQMEQFRETLPKPSQTRIITLSEYNPQWVESFLSEKNCITESFTKFSENLVNIFHIGSTSILGLVAKPIIDIIIVVKNSDITDEPLLMAGYKYKGEYNIPMRKMYGKKNDYEVYLHVYEEGNDDIELNLKFRDYLAVNAEAKEEYSSLKKSIIQEDNSHTKLTSTGITTYNLKKNDFIQKVLIQVGFKGLCIRLCTQDQEWKSYSDIRNDCKVSAYKIDSNDTNQKHIVLYQGTEVVAGAQLQTSPPNAFLVFLGLSQQLDTGKIAPCKSFFLRNIEKWSKKLGVFFLTTSVSSQEKDFYVGNNYKLQGEECDIIYMMKFLGNAPSQDTTSNDSINLIGIVTE